MTPRPPWSQRQTAESVEQFFVLREGVPDGLLGSLLGIVDAYYGDNLDGPDRVAYLARLTDRALSGPNDLLCVVEDDHVLLLDAVDHALSYPDSDSFALEREVKSFLDDARSVYDVTEAGWSRFELTWRQPPEITELVEQATSERSRAADHLRRAWSHACGRLPKPTEACLDAVKAVEAAARTTIEPDNGKATLGTMIKTVEQKPQKWTTSCPADAGSVETVAVMMRMIWKAHLRHGNPDEPLDVPVETCEMLVHTAAVLVHWFTTGKIRTVEPAEL